MPNYRKPPRPADKPTWEAHSTYTADLGSRTGAYTGVHRSPTVADLVRPRDTVLTSYGTGDVVIEVKECFYAAPTGETLSHFTIVYVPPNRAEKYRDTEHHWITGLMSASRSAIASHAV